MPLDPVALRVDGLEDTTPFIEDGRQEASETNSIPPALIMLVFLAVGYIGLRFLMDD